MEKRTRVVVYGSSLHMAAIAASLRADAGLEVIHLEPHAHPAPPSLEEIKAVAIAFDLNDPPPGLDVTLLRERPGLLLIGVDPSSDELLVLRGYTAQALSVRDLANAINRSGFNSE